MAGINRHINELVLKEHGIYTTQRSGQDTTDPKNNTMSFLNGTASTNEESQAFSPYVNWAKVWQLAISYGNVTPKSNNGVLWGNWRRKQSGQGSNSVQINGICDVNSKVQLISEDLSNIGFKYSNHYSDDISIDNLIKNKGAGESVSKIFDALDKGVDTVSAISYTAAGALSYDRGTNTVKDISRQKEGSRRVINNYSNAKGWEGPGTLALNTSEITFRFRFGQAGLYDALEEVFKPALALAGLFSPKEIKSYVYDYLVPNSSFVTGLFGAALLDATIDKINEVVKPVIENKIPSKIADLNQNLEINGFDPEQHIKDEIDKVKSSGLKKLEAPSPITAPDISAVSPTAEVEPSIKSLLDSAIKESGKIASKMLDLNATIEEIKESASTAILAGTKMAYFKIGPFVLGPCYVGSVQLNFDFKNTDSQGIPTEGKVTLKDLYLPYTATNENILETLAKDVYEKDNSWTNFSSDGLRGSERNYK